MHKSQQNIDIILEGKKRKQLKGYPTLVTRSKTSIRGMSCLLGTSRVARSIHQRIDHFRTRPSKKTIEVLLANNGISRESLNLTSTSMKPPLDSFTVIRGVTRS
jgi:hypothetical protein